MQTQPSMMTLKNCLIVMTTLALIPISSFAATKRCDQVLSESRTTESDVGTAVKVQTKGLSPSDVINKLYHDLNSRTNSVAGNEFTPVLNQRRDDLAKRIPSVVKKINGLMPRSFAIPSDVSLDLTFEVADYEGTYMGPSNVDKPLSDHRIRILPFLIAAKQSQIYLGGTFSTIYYSRDIRWPIGVFAHEYGHAISYLNIGLPLFKKFSGSPNLRRVLNPLFAPYSELISDLIEYVAVGPDATSNEIFESLRRSITNQFPPSNTVSGDVTKVVTNNLPPEALIGTRSFNSTRTYSAAALAKDGHNIFVHMRSWLGHHRSAELKDPAKTQIVIAHLFEAVRREMEKKLVQNDFKWKAADLSGPLIAMYTPPSLVLDATKMNLDLLQTFLQVEAESQAEGKSGPL